MARFLHTLVRSLGNGDVGACDRKTRSRYVSLATVLSLHVRIAVLLASHYWHCAHAS